jgi:hypothetical protein
MQLTRFSEIDTDREEKQLFPLSCLLSEKQEHRFLLLQCHAPPESLSFTLFTTGYKRPAEGGLEVFWLLLWVFHFGLWLWDFWCGKIL